MFLRYAFTLFGLKFNGQIKNGRVGTFREAKQVSALSNTAFDLNLDIPEVHQLLNWYRPIPLFDDLNSGTKRPTERMPSICLPQVVLVAMKMF